MRDFTEVEKKWQTIEAIVDDHVDLISVTPEGLASSRERAGKFLVAQAMLTEFLKQVNDELAKQSALKDAKYAQSLKNVEGKNVTEKKINVANDKEYMDDLQKFEELESLREWIKGHIKIFENAHILYRGFSRETI